MGSHWVCANWEANEWGSRWVFSKHGTAAAAAQCDTTTLTEADEVDPPRVGERETDKKALGERRERPLAA